MKKVALLFVLMFAGTALGQASSRQELKIAIIDWDRLSDKTRGVTRLSANYQVVYGLDTEFSWAATKIKREITELEEGRLQTNYSGIPTDETMTRIANLKARYQQLEDSDKAAREKGYSQLIEPILEQIRNLLKQYAVRHAIDLVVDGNLITNSLIVGDTSKFVDITDDFIAYCNRALEKKN